MKIDKYTPEEIERLKQLPGVAKVTSRRICYDEEFRQELYAAWCLNPSKETIRKVFIARGARLQGINDAFITNLHRVFIQQGHPKQQAVPAKHEESEPGKASICFSDSEIERLKQLPGVQTVTPKRIVFDLEFRQAIYDEWVLNPSKETIRNSFIERGAELQESDDHIFRDMHHYFKHAGRPQIQQRYHGADEMVHKTEDELIAEGILYRTFQGTRITQSYLDMLKKAYWESNGTKSVEEIIIESGYIPGDIGKFRVFGIRKNLEEKAAMAGLVAMNGVEKEQTGKATMRGLIWTKNKVEDTPFIRQMKEGCLCLTSFPSIVYRKVLYQSPVTV